MSPIDVIIVEDQPAIRTVLSGIVGTAESLNLVASFDRAEALLETVAASGGQAPAVALMDIGLPGIDGIQATARLKDIAPGCAVIMLTVFEDEERIFASLEAGASGYLLKSSTSEDIVQAIEQIARGESPMSGTIARKVVESFHRPQRDIKTDLSPREREILDLLIEGLRYKEIGARLSISIDTVRTHIRHIYDKMQVRSRGELTARLMGRGGR